MEQTITFRVTKEVKNEIRKKAKEVGLGMAPFSRNCVLQKIRKDSKNQEQNKEVDIEDD